MMDHAPPMLWTLESEQLFKGVSTPPTWSCLGLPQNAFPCHETLFSLFTKGDWAWEHRGKPRAFATPIFSVALRHPPISTLTFLPLFCFYATGASSQTRIVVGVRGDLFIRSVFLSFRVLGNAGRSRTGVFMSHACTRTNCV